MSTTSKTGAISRLEGRGHSAERNQKPMVEIRWFSAAGDELISSVEEDGRSAIVERGFREPAQLDAGDLVETEAIRLAQQGDDRAFQRIYELHSRRVSAVCLRMTGSSGRGRRFDPGSLFTVVPEASNVSGGNILLHLVTSVDRKYRAHALSQKVSATRFS